MLILFSMVVAIFGFILHAMGSKMVREAEREEKQLKEEIERKIELEIRRIEQQKTNSK